MFAIWTEKYRPKELDEVTGQKNVVDRLKHFIKIGQIPNLLFSGPAGVGKTTCALILAKKLLGESWKQNFLELNASDERGINTVRNRIKDYAEKAPMGGSPFRIVFLDEVDNTTSDAQHALRRVMEIYSSICRFILSCNYSNKIIEPVQSRCAMFRFSRLNEEDIKSRLDEIAKTENLDISEDAKDAMVYVSEGDMRKAVNILQAASALGKITQDSIYMVSSQITPKEVQEVLLDSFSGNFLKARETIRKLLLKGLSGEDIISQIHREVFNLDIPEAKKALLIEKIAEFDYRILEGGNDFIQLDALIAQFCIIGSS